MQITDNAKSAITRYIRRIKSQPKREYAEHYLRFLSVNSNGVDQSYGPTWACSYMAAQAVRAQINRIIEKSVQS